MKKPKRSRSLPIIPNQYLRESFKRTTCACRHCRVYCKHMPGSTIPGDPERIAQFLGRECDDAFMAEYFEASEGARVFDVQRGEYRVPTIVPQQKDNGHCVFLDEHGLCSIHPVSPFGCAYNDSHMDNHKGQKVSQAMVGAQSSDPRNKYTKQWEALVAAGKKAKPLAERRQALTIAFGNLGPVQPRSDKER